MGTGSYIVRGKGDSDSWQSCSHGAGRSMSRAAAFRLKHKAFRLVASKLLKYIVLYIIYL